MKQKLESIVIILIPLIILGNLSIVVHALKVPSGKVDSTHFAVTNMSTVYQNSYSGDKFSILGIARNIGNVTYGTAWILVTLYNNKGNLIDVQETKPFFDITTPNSTSPYKFEVYVNASDFDHYTIQFPTQESEYETNDNKINNNSSSSECPLGQYV
jgi:hypothetical protein